MNTETNEVVVENQEAPQLSPIEQKAMDMGWRPISEFSGEEVDFIDAKEFVSRKPLYDKIGQQSKQLKNVTSAIEALKEHHSKVQESAYQQAIRDLKTQRKQALVDGDADKFEQYDDDIKVKEQAVAYLQQSQSNPIVQEVPTVHPDFANWQDKNSWYSSVKYMRDFADELGGRLANTMTPREVLAEVEKQTRKEFPHKFTNPNKTNSPDVGSSQGSGRSSGGDGLVLNEQETKVMNTLIRGGVLTKAEYIADLKKAKGIK